jgi:hypothetical protein
MLERGPAKKVNHNATAISMDCCGCRVVEASMFASRM